MQDQQSLDSDPPLYLGWSPCLISCRLLHIALLTWVACLRLTRSIVTGRFRVVVIYQYTACTVYIAMATCVFHTPVIVSILRWREEYLFSNIADLFTGNMNVHRISSMQSIQ